MLGGFHIFSTRSKEELTLKLSANYIALLNRGGVVLWLQLTVSYR